MEALTGLINTYVQKTDHWNSDDNTSNTRTNHNHSNQTEERAPPTEKAFQGRAHLKTDIKETDNIQKKTDIDRNLYKLIPSILFHTILTMTILSAKTSIEIIITL